MITVISFVAAVALCLGLMKVAPKLGLLAHPGEHRRHSEPTPLVGGIAIFFIIVGFVLFDADIEVGLLGPIILIFLLGALDDRFKLPSLLRFLLQAIAIWWMVGETGIRLDELGELVPGQHVLTQKWALPLTIFAGLGVINAINMSDGMDGLAGCIVVLVLLVFAAVFSVNDQLVSILIGGLAGFLLFNMRVGRSRAVVFLGDAGSTLLGFLLAFMLIKHSQSSFAVYSPVTALWLLALPLFDAVAVLLIRPLRGSSPFSADRIHYHHILQAHGCSVNLTLTMILTVQLLLIIVGLWMLNSGVPDYVQLIAFLSLFIVYCAYLWRFTGDEQKIRN